VEVPFTFDEATHCYQLAGGLTVPSCTRVLDHAGLVSYDMVREDILARKSTIGTIVHLATHYYDSNELDWSSFTDSQVDQENKRRVEAWALFRAETGFVPRIIEQRYIATVNGMRFGLTVDREGLLRGKECIVEIKTSAAVQKWYALQTAGYAMGVPDDAGSSPRARFARRRRMVVQLFPDGRYKKTDFEDPRDADVFISGLHISWWKQMNGSGLKEIKEEAA